MWRYTLKTLALPPAANLLALLLAWRLRARHPLLSNLLVLFSVASLLALSMPAVTLALQNLHVRHGAIDPQELVAFRAGAIVVLGGGRLRGAPEYGGLDQPGSLTFQRIRYGAYLHKRTGVPLLVTGGRVEGESRSEAELMRDALQQSLGGVSSRWLEPHSRTTFENASFSAQILLQEGVQRVALVTHAVHMPRAAALFEQQGLKVLAAPTGFWTPPRSDAINRWVPDAESLLVSARILHEQLGLLWYWLRNRFPALPLPG